MNALSQMTADPIRTFLPGVDDEEHALRSRLVRANIIAAACVFQTKHQHARELFLMVREVAGAWMFAPAAKEQLVGITDTCLGLFKHAREFERLEAPDDEG